MNACEVHGFHRPALLGTVVHHIQPLGAGGLDVATNRVTVCPSGHLNVHRLLDLLWHTSSADSIHGKGTRKERALAIQGFDAWVTAGKPGHPVYELEEPT